MPTNYLLAIASYKEKWKQDFFDNVVSKRNKEYCELHNLEYIEITEGVKPVRGQYFWYKSFKQEEIINTIMNNGDGLIFIDADAIIVDINKNLLPPEGKDYAYAIDTGNTHCTGYFSLIKSDWTKQMFSLINSEDRYQALINKTSFHEGKKIENSFWQEFAEQASWYSLTGIKRHSNISFFDLPNYGFHSSKNEWTHYSLEDLNEHVHIFPPEYNVTELHGESVCLNYINKVKYKNVVIRHFSGGQKWREVWTDTKSLNFKLHKTNLFKFINFYKLKIFIQKVKGFIKSKF